MIQVVKPKIGERIYDGAAGSAGFLCESYEYLRERDLTTSQLNTLQTKTFYAKEKKSLAYVIGIMNMILHGVEAPNIIHRCSVKSAEAKNLVRSVGVPLGLTSGEATHWLPVRRGPYPPKSALKSPNLPRRHSPGRRVPDNR